MVLNVAVFGFGRMGQIHYRNAVALSPRVNVLYVVKRSSETAVLVPNTTQLLLSKDEDRVFHDTKS